MRVLAHYGIVDPLEAYWTVVAAIGFTASVMTAKDALAEHRRATKKYGGDSPEAYVGSGSLVIESIRVFILFSLLLVGLISDVLPEFPQPKPSRQGITILITLLLVAFELLVVSQAVYIRWFRRKLGRLQREAQRQATFFSKDND